MASKKSWEVYNRLIDRFTNEFNILLNVSREELIKVVDERLADLILSNREGKVKVKPGFDGLYGVPLIHGDEDYDFASVKDDEDNPKPVSKTIKENKKDNDKKSSKMKSTKDVPLNKFF